MVTVETSADIRGISTKTSVDCRLTMDRQVGRMSVESRSSTDRHIDWCIGLSIEVPWKVHGPMHYVLWGVFLQVLILRFFIVALVDFRKLAKDNKHSGRETACKTKTISLENTFISERCNMELVDITCMYINIMLRQDKSRKRIASALKKNR